MAASCSRCGAELSIVRRVVSGGMCGACAARESAEQQLALADYRSQLETLGTTLEAPYVRRQLPVLASLTGLNGDRLKQVHLEVLRKHLDQVLDDQLMTLDEEQRLNAVLSYMGFSEDTIREQLKDEMPLLIVARINAGRLPTLANAPIVLKPGEQAHIQMDAKLLKEVLTRQTQSSGVSVRIGRGISFRTSQTTRRTVVVGSSMEPIDTGTLVLTSNRAVFTGASNSLDLAMTKIASVDGFKDGVRVHLSNRRVPPMFRVQPGMGWVAAALITSVAQAQA